MQAGESNPWTRVGGEDLPGTPAVRELVRLCTHRGPTIGAVLLLGIGASLLAAALRAPSYRASAKLALAEEGGEGGLLGSLALLARPPAALAEIEALRSRTIVERAVSEPAASQRDADGDPLLRERLGLTTLVHDEDLATLPHLRGRSREVERARAGAPRLGARLVALHADAERAVRVEFLASDRVRLSRVSALGPILPGSPRGGEFTLAPGEPIEWEGLRLWLAPSGDLAGRRYRVERLSEGEAVQRVLARLSVHETARGSGVIEVVFDDCDPVRAAETVNALCLNYIRRSIDRGERRAKLTLGFIEDQLDLQTRALVEAGEEVLRLQRENPQTIDIAKAAEVLLELRRELESERTRVRLARDAVAEAVELLAEGRSAALSRLSSELSDPLSAAYVEEIAILSAEAERADRDDAGAFRTLLQAQLVELETQAEEIAVELEAQRQTVAGLEAGDRGALARLGRGAAQRGPDPLGAAYLEQLAQLAGARAELEERFTPEHPELREVIGRESELLRRVLQMERSRLEALATRHSEYLGLLEGRRERLAELPGGERARIAAALERVRERTRAHLVARRDALDGRVADLAREMTRLESQLGELPERDWIVSGPRRRLDAHTEIVKFLLGRQQEAEIVRASALAAAEFIDPAVPPTQRRGPSLVLHLLGGIALGLVSGLALAFVRESFDTGILSAAELEDASYLPVFGLVPDFRGGPLRVRGVRADFLALRDAPDGPIAEAYRSLRANLKFALGGPAAVRSVGITSSLPAEGKSVTSINLALAFATSGKRVLLVDADLRWPSVHCYLHAAESPGLIDVLERREAWQDCLVRVQESDLHVLTSGGATGAAGDLLAGDEMEAFLAGVRDAYDLVIFDLPPVLAVADSSAFASRLDAMVLLCRSRKLTRATVQRAAQRLRAGGANLVGAILNADRPRWSSAAYGYEYEYSAPRPRPGSRGRGRRAALAERR